jgi:tetratricopeptide (TPR) repeat protein
MSTSLRIGLVAIVLGASSVRAEPRADELLDRIARCRHGQAATAFLEILEWKADAIAVASRTLADDERCDEKCRRTAVLLHTEAGLVSHSLRHDRLERAHLHAVSRLSEGLPADFVRRWRLAVGYQRQAWAQYVEASRLYDDVLARDKDDPEALVALGSLREYELLLPRSRVEGVLVVVGNDARPSSALTLGAVARLYDRALAVRPDFVEARLRRARLEERLGGSEAGERALQQIVDSSSDPLIVAHAQLFLGELAAHDAQLEAAVAHYREALRIDPRLQPAQLALSHALQRLGRPDEASAVLLAGLQATRDGETHGWFGYHMNTLHDYRRAMDALWAEVQE